MIVIIKNNASSNISIPNSVYNSFFEKFGIAIEDHLERY